MNMIRLENFSAANYHPEVESVLENLYPEEWRK
jgi:hypothetical protein